jgi:hypothetical protein
MNDEQLQKSWNKMMEDIRKVIEHEPLESIEDKIKKIIYNTCGYNPSQTVGTCSKCGEEMLFTVPRIGRDGGYIHKSTGKFLCKDEKPSVSFATTLVDTEVNTEVDEIVEALKQLPSQGFEDYDPKDFEVDPQYSHHESSCRKCNSTEIDTVVAKQKEEIDKLKKELDNSKFGAQCIIHELEYDKKTLIKENEKLTNLLNEAIRLADLMSDEIKNLEAKFN